MKPQPFNKHQQMVQDELLQALGVDEHDDEIETDNTPHSLEGYCD